MLNLRGENVLVAETRQLRAVANPDVVVRYRAGDPLQVSGTVTIPEADINLERLDEGVSASEDVVVLDPVDPGSARRRTGSTSTSRWRWARTSTSRASAWSARLAATCACARCPGARCANRRARRGRALHRLRAEARHHPRAAAVVEHAGRRSDPRRARRTRGRRRHRDQGRGPRRRRARRCIRIRPRANPRRCPRYFARSAARLDSLSSNEARQLARRNPRSTPAPG